MQGAIMQKVIMFNGPPLAGKDTAGKICKALLGDDVHLVKFTDPLKAETHHRYGLDCANDAYEALKDTPLPEFGGITPRVAYTQVSDDMKRKHGPHCWADILIHDLQRVRAPLIVNTDCGYDFEGMALRDYVGAQNATLVRLHRPNHDYSSDCRGWVYLDDVASFDLTNDLDHMVLRGRLRPIVDQVCQSLDLAPAY